MTRIQLTSILLVSLSPQHLRCRGLSLATLVRTKFSHEEFMVKRDWSLVKDFWKSCVRNGHLPEEFTLNPNYANTDCGLREIEAIGALAEFQSKDPRYLSRKTYALRVGYLGTEYYGYQWQKSMNSTEIRTVEGDIYDVLKKSLTCSGRTDREVSALSQSISAREGRLAAYECVQVPRKFNARSQAIWRRYVYIFPLNIGDEVDVDFVNAALQCLESKPLSYSALAFKEHRGVSESGPLDKCTIASGRAGMVSVGPEAQPCIAIELVGDRFLRRMVRVIVATAIRESTFSSSLRRVNILEEICNTNNRDLASVAAPGTGLALCGVGYDEKELAFHKHMTAATRRMFEDRFS